jgi:hypothetical protein
MSIGWTSSLLAARRVFLCSSAFTLLLAGLAGCKGGGEGAQTESSKSGTLTTQVSDPAPCVDLYEHVWVTIRDIKANLAASAKPDDAGFVDLTPGLEKSPKQVDLLGPLTSCFPAALGTISGVKAGTYQQVLVMLLDNALPESGAAPPMPNACRTIGDTQFNCVVDLKGNVHQLKLPREASTGIKIPTAQLACGGMPISAEHEADIEIYFNSCASIKGAADSNSFMLKPTIWARIRPRGAP